MNEPVWTLGELTVIALAVPLAPFVAWALSDLYDAVVGWLTDAPDLQEVDQ